MYKNSALALRAASAMLYIARLISTILSLRRAEASYEFVSERRTELLKRRDYYCPDLESICPKLCRVLLCIEITTVQIESRVLNFVVFSVESIERTWCSNPVPNVVKVTIITN